MENHKLIVEVWEDFDDKGNSLPALLYAGPRGDESRRTLGTKAHLLRKFSASCHFEAMTIYYEQMGWGPYTTVHEWDRKPYPEDWIIEQQKAGVSL